MAVLDGEAEGLDINLGKALGAAHDISRIHCLVSGDHHHLLHIVFDAFVRNIARACHVHKDCLARVLLHQRDMFVGRRMEDYLRTPFAEGIVQTGSQANVTDDRHELQFRELFFKLETKVVHRSLGIVEEDEFLDPEGGKLAAEFGPDGSGCSCHHYGPVSKITDNLIHGDADFRTHEQVLDLDVTDNMGGPAIHHLIHRRCKQKLYAELHRISDDPVPFLTGICFRGKEQRLHIESFDHTFVLLLRAHIIDLLLRNHMIDLAVAELNETHYVVVRRVLETAQKGDGLDVYTIDQDIMVLSLIVHPDHDEIIDKQHGYPQKEKESEGQEEIGHNHDVEKPCEGEHQSEGNACGKGLATCDQDEESHLAQGHMTDDDPVGAELPDEQEGEDRGKSSPYRQELPAEGSRIQEKVDQSEHHKGCGHRHDHIKQEDHPRAHVSRHESRHIFVERIQQIHDRIGSFLRRFRTSGLSTSRFNCSLSER